MIICRSVRELRQQLDGGRRQGRRIGLVPTMGALHDGHLSLVRAAAAECDETVVSIFVNPAQFNQASDLQSYPRDEARDVELARSAGATVVFVPSVEEIYPAGSATEIRIHGVSERWEGESRGRTHFDGVALIVAKLLNMVGPDLAWFGDKDAQQVAVVRQLVADLNIGAEIRTGPTVREPDGLAMSSRNVGIRAEDRPQARSLYRALQEIGRGAANGVRSTEELRAGGAEVLRVAGVEPDYLAIVDPQTFAPLSDLGHGPGLAIVAARIGDVRLIDNETVGLGHPDR